MKKMEFSAAFATLKKFTVGLSPPLPDEEAITTSDINMAAEYLGIDLSGVPSHEHIRSIENELSYQDEFLTDHLSDSDIEKSELYGRSQFVREIVINNRTRARSRRSQNEGEP